MPSLPLFSLLSSSEDCQSLRTAPLNHGDHHRLRGNTTGWSMWPPALNSSIGCKLTAGRHWMPAEPATHSSRGEILAWQCNSKHVCTKHTPYHTSDSKEDMPRFSDHQSRISMHDGPKNQECNFDLKCMQFIESNKGAKPPSNFTSRGLACTMQMQP